MAADLVEAIVAAAEDSYEVFVQQLDKQKDPDWLGGAAIVTAPIVDRQPFQDAAAVVQTYPGIAAALEVPAEATQAFLYANGRESVVATGVSIVAHLLNHAAVEAHWSPNPFNMDTFIANCKELAKTLAAWAADKSARFTAIRAVGIYNVFLRSDAAIETPWGTLLAAPRRPELPQVFTSGIATFQISVMTTGDGPALDQRDRPSAYLLQREQITLTTEELPSNKGKLIFSDESPEMVAEKLAFAIVLAVGDPQLDAPVFGGSSTSNPITSGAGGSSVPVTAYQGMRVIHVQTPEEEAKVADYSERVAGAPKAILFAGRRLLRAINSNSVEDALVDAVVVWETIFGAKTETTYRVTLAVTKTLSPIFKDGVTELELHKRLSEIYSLRSGIVHGNSEQLNKMTSAKLYDYMSNARRWSHLLLLEAFKWPPKVLASKSERRSLRVLLDPNWPQAE